MRKIMIFFAVMTAAVILRPLPTLAATKTWDAGAGTSDWGTAINWSGDALPLNGDAIIVAATAFNPVISAASPFTVANVTVQSGATLTISGSGSLTANDFIVNGGGTFLMSGGTLSHGKLTSSGTVTISGGTITSNDNYTISAGSFTQSGGTITDSGKTMNMNSGTVLQTGGTMYFKDFKISSGVTFAQNESTGASLVKVGHDLGCPAGAAVSSTHGMIWKVGDTASGAGDSYAGTCAFYNFRIENVAAQVKLTTGTVTAHALLFGLSYQVAGTWGSTASAATNKNNTYFDSTGTGLMTVATSGGDVTPPSGGWISYLDGYYTTTSVDITYSSGTDAESGMNTSSGHLWRSSASLTNGSCGSFGPWYSLVQTVVSPYTDNSVLSGNCYMFEYAIADNAGNWATSTSPNVAKIDDEAPSGGSITYTDGGYSVASVPISFALGSDGVSGLDLSSGKIQRASATLSGGVCGGYGVFTDLVATSSGSYTDDSVLSDNCYMYQYVINDQAGNIATYTSANQAKVHTDAADVATAKAALTAAAPLNPVEGVDSSVITMAQAIVDGAVSGVTVTVSASANGQVASPSGAITYGAADNGNVTFTLTKNLANDTDVVAVHVPATLIAPVISSVVATPGSSGATITWTTDKLASSQVKYSPDTSYASSTAEIDTSPRVTSHTVSITNLVSCASYHYRVISRDVANNAATSTDRTFTTTGCPGNATIYDQTAQNIVITGGTVTLTYNGETVTLQIPNNYYTSQANFQIKTLDGSMALGTLGTPNGFSAIGAYIWNLRALLDSQQALINFNQPITIVFTYTAADVAGINENTLKIFHYVGGAWTELTSCSVNKGAKTVTCTTNSFSNFGLFGVHTAASTLGGGSLVPVTPQALTGQTLTMVLDRVEKLADGQSRV